VRVYPWGVYKYIHVLMSYAASTLEKCFPRPRSLPFPGCQRQVAVPSSTYYHILLTQIKLRSW